MFGALLVVHTEGNALVVAARDLEDELGIAVLPCAHDAGDLLVGEPVLEGVERSLEHGRAFALGERRHERDLRRVPLELDDFERTGRNFDADDLPTWSFYPVAASLKRVATAASPRRWRWRRKAAMVLSRL